MDDPRYEARYEQELELLLNGDLGYYLSEKQAREIISDTVIWLWPTAGEDYDYKAVIERLRRFYMAYATPIAEDLAEGMVDRDDRR